jgi:hypothetical protein
MLTYASGFNPTTEVEPFFAGMHTVSSFLFANTITFCRDSELRDSSSTLYCTLCFFRNILPIRMMISLFRVYDTESGCVGSPRTPLPLRTPLELDTFVDIRPSRQ